MGNPRPRPSLLAQKLLIIREHLNLSQTAIKDSLDLSAAARVSDYENGKRKPSLIVTLAYSRLAQVPMASVVDDEINLKAFRKQLGTFDYAELKNTGGQAVEPKHAPRKSKV